MKTNYQCEICKSLSESKEDTIKCENSHTILRSEDFKWYWFVPFVAWFLVPFFLFTNKKSIIIFSKNLKGELTSMYITSFPFILMILVLMMMIIKF